MFHFTITINSRHVVPEVIPAIRMHCHNIHIWDMIQRDEIETLALDQTKPLTVKEAAVAYEIPRRKRMMDCSKCQQ